KRSFATVRTLFGRIRARRPKCTSENAPVAQLDRAPDYESGGQEFESLRARHSAIVISPPRPVGVGRMPHFVAAAMPPIFCCATAAALALSRREDARTSAVSLGDLRAVARSRVLHGLGLCRRKVLTHILGTARSIEGCLGVALELRHHLA